MKNIKLSLLLLSAIVLAWCSTKTTTPTDATTNTGTTSPTIEYTLANVATHATQADCWTTINGNVYDITSAFGKHPGWDDKILWLCGVDWTEKFNTKHWTNEKAKWRLATLMIWKLK